MSTKPPAFQFYAADYLADENVALMTLEEEGAYIRAVVDACRRNDAEFLAGVPWVGRFDPISRGKNHRLYISKRVRADVLSSGECVTCGSTKDLHVDHIIPVCRGGSPERSNLQPLCRQCNQRKAARLAD